MAGRKKLPKEKKVIQGTFRPDRENKNAPKPPAKKAKAPTWLNKVAKKEYNRVVKILDELGMMTEMDQLPLAAYAQVYSRWRDAEEAIDKEGSTIKTTNGNVIQNPQVGIANKCLELMKWFCSEFGFGPASRARLSIDRKGSESDPEEDYFNARKAR